MTTATFAVIAGLDQGDCGSVPAMTTATFAVIAGLTRNL